MMRMITCIWVILLGIVVNSAAFAEENADLLPKCGQTPFDLCGYVSREIWNDEKRNVFVVEPTFEIAEEFSDGLAAVRVDGRYGYIDESGEFAIDPQFEKVGDFRHGMALVGNGGAFGVIDRWGEYLVEPTFSQAIIFNDQTLLATDVKNSDWGWELPYDHSINNAGLYHITKGWLTEQKHHFERFDASQKKLLWAQVQAGRPGTFDDLIGLMRDDGTWLIEPQFSYAREVHDDRAIVRKRINGSTISGVIDASGREVIPFVFDYLTYWERGYLQAGKGDYPDRKYGIVTRDGELLAGRYFDKIEGFFRYHGPSHPPHVFFSVKDGKEWKSLFTDGEILPDQRVGTVFLECEQFKILYDINGYELQPKDLSVPTIQFDGPLFSYTNQRCSPPPSLVRDGSYAKILENGASFGGFFENSKGFFANHLWVSVNGKWGLVDAEGNFVVEPIYDYVYAEGGYLSGRRRPSDIARTTFKVSIGDKDYRLSYVDGDYVQEPFVETPESRSGNVKCPGGSILKSKDGLWGMIDKDGNYLIAPKFRAISCFDNGVALVPVDDLRRWCPIDRNGKLRTSPDCLDDYYPRYTSHSSPEKFHDDPYENNVLWVRAWLDYGEGRREDEPRMIPW